MYHPSGYVWLAILIGPIAFIVLVSAMMYAGAIRAGLQRRTALLVAGGTAIVPGGWMAIGAEIAAKGWYKSTTGPLILSIAMLGALTVFIALSLVPVFRRSAMAPGMLSRLILPQTVRVTGVGPLLYLALGHLPASFALAAALGDITTGIAAPFVARRLAKGANPREGIWFNVYGIADLVNSTIIASVIGVDLSQLPIALVPSTVVPMLLALHVISVRSLAAAAKASHPPARSASAAV